MAEAKICRWYRGKRAALSLRFDDSHPTHVEKAVPMLDAQGLVGTFLINPGNPGYDQFRADWEGAVIQRGHELGNHTLNHRGAKTDAEAETQIGGCAEQIWRLQPERGKLLAFQRGGATTWLQRKPFKFFHAKYSLFVPGASMSCSEAYPSFTFKAFRERFDRALAGGEWMECHFHGIDAGHLFITTPVFQRMLEHIRSHPEVWQTGMAAAHKYQEERDRAHLIAHPDGDDALALHLACATESELYNHPLTLEVTLPDDTADATVIDSSGNPIDARIETTGIGRVLQFEAPPVDGVYTVRGRGLGETHRKTHGPELEDPGPHPYLFFGLDDLPALREKMGRKPAMEMWERVKADADRILESAPPEHPHGPTTMEQARASSGRLRTLAAVHGLTGEASYALRASPEIEVILAADSWSHPQHRAVADLVSAEISCSLGLAYDWMHDLFPEDQRKRVLEAIVERGLEPIIEATEKKAWWTHWYRCNWGAVIYGQAGVTALSILADEPKASDWVRVFREKLWHFGQAIGRDGSWGESVSYASYAWSNGALFMDALSRLTGGRINLFDNPRLLHLTEWFLHLLTPDESGFVPFSNCGRGTRFPGQFLFRMAREYGDGQAQWMAQRMGSQGIFGFLWCDPDIAPKPPDDLPVAKIFEDLDWAVLRSRWGDPKATLFALKGGQKDWDHNHHDTNGFVLFAQGRPLIVDLLYPREIWGCGTEAHNTITVNGREQRGTVRVQGCRGKPDHRGIVDDLVTSSWHARLVGDASMAYEPDDVNSFVREVIHLRRNTQADPPEAFILFDDVDAKAPVRMDWRLHTYGEIRAQGNRFTVIQDDAAADVTLVAPTEFAHEIREKALEEAGAPPPFDGARAVTFLTLRPEEPVRRGHFLSVIAPRPASAEPGCSVVGVQGENTLGTRITHGGVEDLALFSLDAPEMRAGGIEAIGRSCLVRKSKGRITAAALHAGQRLQVDGSLLFETNHNAHASLEIGEEGVTVRMAIYDGTKLAIHAARKPARILADGRELAFEHDADCRCARMECQRVREVQVLYA